MLPNQSISTESDVDIDIKEVDIDIKESEFLSPTNLEAQPLLSTDKNPTDESVKNDVPFSLPAQVGLGISRDTFWALSAFKGWDWPFSRLGKTWGSWLNQFGMGAAALSTASLGMFALNPKFRTRTGAAVISMYAAASLLAIIPWNYAQSLGAETGENDLNLTTEEANYYSSIYTGIFEAVVQYAVISAVSAALDAKEKAKWKLDLNHGLQRSVELLLSIPGGAMWQIVFQATYEWAQKNVQNLILSSSGVALSVAGTTYLTTKLAESITHFIDHRLAKEAPEADDGEKLDHPDENRLMLVA